MNKDLVDELNNLQARENDGRGISCVKQIVAELYADRVNSAKAITNNEWDKIANYPRVAQMIKNIGLAKQSAYISK